MSTEYTPTLQFEYKNWLCKVNKRKVIPYEVWYGITEFHKKEQWLLRAFDVNKNAERNFALKDIVKFL